MDLPQLQPPERLLCGPGPTNVDPAVLDAMRKPMLGHLDPDLHDILLDVVAMLRRVYRMPDGLVLPLHCTGTAGMETGIANLLEPGDTVIVAQCGFFGRRISEIARRHGAEVVAVEADWGECVSNDALLEELDRHPGARMVAVVHAETSTGVEHPLAELGAALRDRDTLLMADCVTSLAGVPLDVGAWGVDFAYSCTQKCLAAPPGMSPLAVSERALERLALAAHAGALLLRPAPAGALLDRPPGDLSPHGADPRHLRAARGAPKRPRRGARGALGTARRCRRAPPGCGGIARPRAPRGRRPPARAAHRGARARGPGRQGRPDPHAARARTSRSAAGSGPTRRRCGESA